MTISDHSRHGVLVDNLKLSVGENRALHDGDVVTLPFDIKYMFVINPGGGARVTIYPISIWEMTVSILSSLISLAHTPYLYPG